MDALTERTIRRLCERLEAFRLKGPIPALMAEFRVGAPPEETGPLEDFVGALWAGALRQLPNGATSSRCLWLSADPAVVADFRNFCRDAGRVAVPLLHASGYRVGSGTTDLTARWLWAVFELAELRLAGTDLRLVGDTVWRMGAGRVALGEGIVDNPGPFAGLAATAADTRYWRLADAVEASLAALDVAQLGQGAPAPTTPHQTAVPANGRRRSTRKIDVDTALGKLETKLRKELVRELGSDSAAEIALVDRLYSLSAEALVPMLKSVGCKTSARTVYRPGNSKKYEAWGRYRRPVAAPDIAVDVGPAALSGRPADGGDAADDTLRGWRRDAGLSDVRPSAADAAADAIDSGHLSKRTGGRGTTRIGKTAAEKAAEDAADRFAREAGIDLPPAE